MTSTSNYETFRDAFRPGARLPWLLVLVPGLWAGCSADGGTPSGGGGEGGSAPSGGPVYVVHSTIDTNDARMGYLTTTASIEGDVDVDITAGIEIPGGGYLYAPPSGKFVLVGGSESPTFTRYDLADDGRLSEGDTVSFANLGVAYTYRHVIFVSDEQAYFLDESQLQIVRF